MSCHSCGIIRAREMSLWGLAPHPLETTQITHRRHLQGWRFTPRNDGIWQVDGHATTPHSSAGMASGTVKYIEQPIAGAYGSIGFAPDRPAECCRWAYDNHPWPWANVPGAGFAAPALRALGIVLIPLLQLFRCFCLLGVSFFLAAVGFRGAVGLGLVWRSGGFGGGCCRLAFFFCLFLFRFFLFFCFSLPPPPPTAIYELSTPRFFFFFFFFFFFSFDHQVLFPPCPLIPFPSPWFRPTLPSLLPCPFKKFWDPTPPLTPAPTPRPPPPPLVFVFCRAFLLCFFCWLLCVGVLLFCSCLGCLFFLPPAAQLGCIRARTITPPGNWECQSFPKEEKKKKKRGVRGEREREKSLGGWGCIMRLPHPRENQSLQEHRKEGRRRQKLELGYNTSSTKPCHTTTKHPTTSYHSPHQNPQTNQHNTTQHHTTMTVRTRTGHAEQKYNRDPYAAIVGLLDWYGSVPEPAGASNEGSFACRHLPRTGSNPG